MTAKQVIQVHKDSVGDWRWTKYRGEEVLDASDQGYENKAHAAEMAEYHNPRIELVVPPDE